METSRRAIGHEDDDVLLEEEEEVRKLEEEVNQRAEKILEYRATLPPHLRASLASIQRPTRSIEVSQSQPASSTPSDIEGPHQFVAPLAGEVQEEAERVELLKQKISSNASAIPTVLNRMKECMARIDKLQSSNKVIHPAFKRKRTS